MVAAQWGEIRDPDARTGGGVSGRFRPLGDVGEVPDTTPPPFGTSPWGYRRSEVDAWASWVAGLVAHGRNETIRADSAEATLRATLERLEQLERPEPTVDSAASGPLPVRPGRNGPDGAGTDADPAGAPPNPSTPDGDTRGDAAATGAKPAGRLHFDAPADLPRRIPRGASAASAPETGGSPDTGDAADQPPRDHDLARLHVVETTLHEVLELLHHLADRKRS